MTRRRTDPSRKTNIAIGVLGALTLVIVALIVAAVLSRGEHDARFTDIAPTERITAVAAGTDSGTSSGALPLPSLTPTPTPAPTPSPTPAPTPKDGLTVTEPGVYTIAWVSDPQHYAEERPDIYALMFRYLRDEQKRLNIKYLVCTGDIVHHYNSTEEWDVASDAFSRVKYIPYGVLAGNHDTNGTKHRVDNYKKYFGEAAMRARPSASDYYGGSFDDNIGHYDLIKLGSLKLVFVYLSYDPGADAIAWANSVFEKYSSRIGVLCLHEYFNTKMERSSEGEELYKKIVEKNDNVYMVMCGHRYNVGCKPVSVKCGDGGERTVYQMISNYQAVGECGSGYMQFIQVDTINKELRVYSYSPFTEDRRFHDNPEAAAEKYKVDPDNEEYTLKFPW